MTESPIQFGPAQRLPGRHPARILHDTLRNFITGLGTTKDPRSSSHWWMHELDRNALESAYRSDWLARRLVDLPGYDSTREWRTWQAGPKQLQAIDRLEKRFFLRHKTMLAIQRARLYGGGALVLGVDVGEPEDELDPDDVGKDDLKFVVVLNRYELAAGPRIYNVASPYYTRPEYYTVSTPMFGFQGEEGGSFPDAPQRGTLLPPRPQGQSPPLSDPKMMVQPSYGMIRVHPSRVIEFSGNPLPDWRLAPMGGGWGDSILQTVDDSLRDFAMIMGGLASVINDMKLDIVSVPELSRHLATDDATAKFLQRWTLANQAKSTINTLLIDENEKWQRIQTSFGGTSDLIRVSMQVACAAGNVPMSRVMGMSPNQGLGTEGGGAGEVDLRAYYDDLANVQKSDYRRIMYMMDRVIVASATGENDEDLDYHWDPLYQPDPAQEADVALKKAQATQIYVGLGLINEEAFREGVASQLTEDKTYPALEQAIDKYGLEPEEPEPAPVQNLPTPPPGMLNKGQFDPNPFHMLRAQQQAKSGQPIRVPPHPPRKPPIPASMPQSAKEARDYDPDEPRDPHGQWTSGGGGAAAGSAAGGAAAVSGATGAGGQYGLVPGDVEKFHALKDQWAKVNNELLADVDTPDSPEARAKLAQLESLVHQMHGLHADPGTPEGIGLPGGPRDVTIVGAGPGGLSASIFGGAEGLDTLVVEGNAVAGGQAKYSSRIENFPGFPVGVTGERLTKDMFEQAERVGAEAKLGVRVTGLSYDASTGMKHLTLSDGEEIDSRAVILAGGVEFRHLDFPGADGPGVIVGDGKALTRASAGGEAVVVGGSNGAAQAALGAATKADHVTLLSRSPVANGMSDYQIEALHNQPKITVIEGDNVAKLNRDAAGNPVSLVTTTGKTLPCKAIGLFVGSVPETEWLAGTGVERDKAGRVRTDSELETAIPGVFAVGDMREGAIGRIGVAVGEGQLALRQSYVYLDKLKTKGTAADAWIEDAEDLDRFTSRLFDLDRANPYFGQTVEGLRPGRRATRDFNPYHDPDTGRFTSSHGSAEGKAKAQKAAATTKRRSEAAKAAHARRRQRESEAFPLPQNATPHEAGVTAVSRALHRARGSPATKGEVAAAAKADIKQAVEAFTATRHLKEPKIPEGMSAADVNTAYRFAVAVQRFVKDPDSRRVLAQAITKNSMTWAAKAPEHLLQVAHHGMVDLIAEHAAGMITDAVIGGVIGGALGGPVGGAAGGVMGSLFASAVRTEVHIGVERLADKIGLEPEHVKHLLGGVGKSLSAHYQKWKRSFGHLTGHWLGKSPLFRDPQPLIERRARARDAEIDEADPIERALALFDDAIEDWQP